MAQLRIIRVPLVGGGIAYLRWGPLWRPRGAAENLHHLKELLERLKEEYVDRRHLLLRMIPNEMRCDNQYLHQLYLQHGFTWKQEAYRTIMLDLTPSQEQLRKNLTARWRRQLNISERKNLTVSEGSSSALFEIFIKIYREMVQRKAFVPGLDAEEFLRMQEVLPEALKMWVMVASLNGMPVAAIVCSHLGDTGIYLLGSSSGSGLKSRGSYLLHWRMIQWLKERGAKYYDLSGYNPDKAPGTATFKEGFSGVDTRYLGQYQCGQASPGYIMIRAAETIRPWLDAVRTKVL